LYILILYLAQEDLRYFEIMFINNRIDNIVLEQIIGRLIVVVLDTAFDQASVLIGVFGFLIALLFGKSIRKLSFMKLFNLFDDKLEIVAVILMSNLDLHFIAGSMPYQIITKLG